MLIYKGSYRTIIQETGKEKSLVLIEQTLKTDQVTDMGVDDMTLAAVEGSEENIRVSKNRKML